MTAQLALNAKAWPFEQARLLLKRIEQARLGRRRDRFGQFGREVFRRHPAHVTTGCGGWGRRDALRCDAEVCALLELVKDGGGGCHGLFTGFLVGREQEDLRDAVLGLL